MITALVFSGDTVLHPLSKRAMFGKMLNIKIICQSSMHGISDE
jgi:hypothetical protein